VIPEFASRPFVRALAQHDPEIISREKGPLLRINWIFGKAQDVLVVMGGNLEISYGQYSA